MIERLHQPGYERNAMTREEQTPDADDVDEHGRRLPRAEDSEVEEQGYRFPRDDGRAHHPATSDPDAEEPGARRSG